MKGRSRVAGAIGGGPPADLLSCFPSTARLALMPKSISSPPRPADLGKHRPSRPVTSPLFRSNTAKRAGGGGAAFAGGDIADEPTSPKVTCAGQIKVRPSSGRKPLSSSAGDGKSWMSVMEEMERLHRNNKKPIMHFLYALRGILRLNLTCFGSFHRTVNCCTDEGVDGEEEEAEEDKDLEDCSSRTLLSKWFMALDNQIPKLNTEIEKYDNLVDREVGEEEGVPPQHALLLMRCRSAPTKGTERLMNDDEEEEMVEKDNMKEKNDSFFTRYTQDFIELSSDTMNEKWVVGKFGIMTRSQSCKG